MDTLTDTEIRALAAFVLESAPLYREDVVGALLKSAACIVLRDAHGQKGLESAVCALANKVEAIAKDAGIGTCQRCGLILRKNEEKVCDHCLGDFTLGLTP